MRIITGKYKGMTLNAVPGNTTRPTTDYTRELIYSTLFDVEDMTVLDLFSGSGALAFEALSRGAKFARLVDGSEKAYKTIRSNAEKLRCLETISIHKCKVDAFLKKTTEKYDLILLDPPYNKGLVNETLSLIYHQELWHEGTTVVVEHDQDEPIQEVYQSFIIKVKRSGKTLISFMEMGNQMVEENEDEDI